MTDPDMHAPSISIAMVVYQQEDFVRDAVRSILSQDCDPAEILICDDCSSDRTFEIVSEECDAYDGPHSVRYWQSSKNAGPGNLQLLLPQTKGDIVVVAHGDDIARSDRVRLLSQAIEETGTAIASSNATIIDERGAAEGPLLTNAVSGLVSATNLLERWNKCHLGATHGFRRSVFEAFQPWTVERFFGTADTVFPIRAELLGGCYFIEEPLVQYRRHENNMSLRLNHIGFTTRQRREHRLSRKIATRRALLQDFQDFARQHPESVKAKNIGRNIEESLSECLGQWIAVRNQLLSNKKHPVWVKFQDLAAIRGSIDQARPDGATPISWFGRGRRILARRMRRLADAIYDPTGYRRSERLGLVRWEEHLRK